MYIPCLLCIKTMCISELSELQQGVCSPVNKMQLLSDPGSCCCSFFIWSFKKSILIDSLLMSEAFGCISALVIDSPSQLLAHAAVTLTELCCLLGWTILRFSFLVSHVPGLILLPHSMLRVRTSLDRSDFQICVCRRHVRRCSFGKHVALKGESLSD